MGTVNQMMLKFRRKNYEHTEFWEKSQTWVAGEIAHKTGWVGFISKPETGGTGLNLWKFQTGQKVEVHSQLDKWIDPNIRMFRAYRGKPSRAGRQDGWYLATIQGPSKHGYIVEYDHYDYDYDGLQPENRCRYDVLTENIRPLSLPGGFEVNDTVFCTEERAGRFPPHPLVKVGMRGIVIGHGIAFRNQEGLQKRVISVKFEAFDVPWGMLPTNISRTDPHRTQQAQAHQLPYFFELLDNGEV